MVCAALTQAKDLLRGFCLLGSKVPLHVDLDRINDNFISSVSGYGLATAAAAAAAEEEEEEEGGEEEEEEEEEERRRRRRRRRRNFPTFRWVHAKTLRPS